MRKDITRSAVIVLCAGGILWLGFDALAHIDNLYDTVCPGAGPGYCAGIGQDTVILRLLVTVAAGAVSSFLAFWWHYRP